mmetsp:Transcript_23886/g.36970  ORF Transcript_23886/g.36970 Transcript_23886/m.36970 type:complete len:144 (+) Transcript_23886:276-707(+)
MKITGQSGKKRTEVGLLRDGIRRRSDKWQENLLFLAYSLCDEVKSDVAAESRQPVFAHQRGAAQAQAGPRCRASAPQAGAAAQDGVEFAVAARREGEAIQPGACSPPTENSGGAAGGEGGHIEVKGRDFVPLPVGLLKIGMFR